MKLKNGSLAPELNTLDVYGNSIRLSDYKGKKVLLSFHRFIGCPVCNLRVHSLEQLAMHDIQVINVYESNPETMRKYLADTLFTASFIADQHNHLYKQYGVNKSWLQFFIGFIKDGMIKGMKGMKLFKGGIKGMPMPDSSFSRIPADFLIDENGTITESYYGKHFGDELPIDRIKELVNQ